MNVIPASVVAIFCEDIREEVGGTHSIIGVISDTAQVEGMPGAMPKLGIMLRMAFDANRPPKKLSTMLRWKGAAEHLSRQDVDPNTIASAAADTLSDGTAVMSIIARYVASPLPVSKEDQLQAVVFIDDIEYVVGSLNFRMAKAE